MYPLFSFTLLKAYYENTDVKLVITLDQQFSKVYNRGYPFPLAYSLYSCKNANGPYYLYLSNAMHIACLTKLNSNMAIDGFWSNISTNLQSYLHPSLNSMGAGN